MINIETSKTYLKDYDIYVKHYLDYAQIQHIAEEVIKLSTWAERQEIIDYMVLCYATSEIRTNIDKTKHEDMINSGLIEAVKKEVYNYYLIDKAIAYEESLGKQFNKLLAQLPQVAQEAIAEAQKKELKK